MIEKRRSKPISSKLKKLIMQRERKLKSAQRWKIIRVILTRSNNNNKMIIRMLHNKNLIKTNMPLKISLHHLLM